LVPNLKTQIPAVSLARQVLRFLLGLYVPKPRNYTPDFYLTKYGFYIETKGYLTSLDRTKHKLIKDQHPDIDIRFIFQNARNLLRKHSKTTYGAWCDKYGFMYAEKRMPEEWMKKTILT
jgi:hypothetical protein